MFELCMFYCILLLLLHTRLCLVFILHVLYGYDREVAFWRYLKANAKLGHALMNELVATKSRTSVATYF